MRYRYVWWCVCFSAAAVGTQACNSDTTSSEAGGDSGTGLDVTAGGDAVSATDSASQPDVSPADAAPSMICDASIVTTMNACTQCATMNCGMQLATCAADCMCAQPETCALTLSNVFILNKCPNAVNAGFSNQAFMFINACLAQYCLAVCMHVDAGDSEGGIGDSGAPEASATEAGGVDASGQ